MAEDRLSMEQAARERVEALRRQVNELSVINAHNGTTIADLQLANKRLKVQLSLSNSDRDEARQRADALFEANNRIGNERDVLAARLQAAREALGRIGRGEFGGPDWEGAALGYEAIAMDALAALEAGE